MIRKKTVALAAAGILVAAVAGVGAAYASIPAPDGTINGCYSSGALGTGDLYVIDSAATCPSGYTALNWDQSGSSGWESVNTTASSSSVNGPPTYQEASATAVCPTGKFAVSGGHFYEISSVYEPEPTGVAVVKSEPSGFASSLPQSWSATVESTAVGSSPAKPGTLHVYVMCADRP